MILLSQNCTSEKVWRLFNLRVTWKSLVRDLKVGFTIFSTANILTSQLVKFDLIYFHFYAKKKNSKNLVVINYNEVYLLIRREKKYQIKTLMTYSNVCLYRENCFPKKTRKLVVVLLLFVCFYNNLECMEIVRLFKTKIERK